MRREKVLMVDLRIQKPKYKSVILKVVLALFAASALYLINLNNYLLFHSFAELFCIIIAFALFIIAWGSRSFLEQYFGYLMFISIAYMFIAFLDLLHTLSYTGMQIFNDYDNYANQIWIAARYLESLSLLVPFIFLHYKKRISPHITIAFYTVVVSVVISSVFYFKIFPVCFIDGGVPTYFKIVSEYLICLILVIDVILLKMNKNRFDAKVYRYLFWSIITAAVSELEFTFYISNYAFSNLAGHIFKILSFYLIYKAVAQNCIAQPYESVFKELMDEKEKLARMMMTDELTGLYNRKAAFEFLGKMLKNASRSKESLTICYIDVDELKDINDRYGYIQGDIMLVTVSKFLTCYVRESDYICRIGGDEFLLILPNTDISQAEYMIKRVRGSLMSYNSSSSEIYEIDFSYGFAEYNELNQVSVDALVEKADDDMYQGKMQKKKEQQTV